ncbi:MAG: thioredoxin family protein [Bacteroidota bacterium]
MVRKSKDVGYHTINATEADEILFNSDGIPIVMAFSAEWTGNGQMLDNYYRELANEYNDTIRFYRIDVDDFPSYADKYGVNQIPTTLVFRQNEIVDHFKGLLPRNKIEEKLDRVIKD